MLIHYDLNSQKYNQYHNFLNYYNLKYLYNDQIYNNFLYQENSLLKPILSNQNSYARKFYYRIWKLLMKDWDYILNQTQDHFHNHQMNFE